MNKPARHILAIILSILTSALSQESAGNTNLESFVSGKVYDWQRKPVAGMHLLFTDKNKNLLAEHVTDESGQYVQVIADYSFPIQVEASKKGYKSYSTKLNEATTRNLEVDRCLRPGFMPRLRKKEGEELQSAVVEMLASWNWRDRNFKREVFKIEEFLRNPLNEVRKNRELIHAGISDLARDWLIFTGELEGDNAHIYKYRYNPSVTITNMDLSACIMKTGSVVTGGDGPEYEYRVDQIVFNRTFTKAYAQCASWREGSSKGWAGGKGYDLCFTKVDGIWTLTAIRHTWLT